MITATAPHATRPSTLVSVSSSRCNGDLVRTTLVSIEAICPIWVCIPVAVTIIEAVPRVTEVFWNSMLVWSPRPTSTPSRGLASLGMGALSPVRAASWVSRVAARRIRPSAGRMSPASTATTSPGTRSLAEMVRSCPSRTTRACGTCSLASASTLARALSSCREPRTTLSTISRPTITPVDTSPITRLTSVTAINIRFIGSRSWPSATATIDGGFSAAISFRPYVATRCPASASPRPCSPSEPSRASTSAALEAYGGAVSASG